MINFNTKRKIKSILRKVSVFLAIFFLSIGYYVNVFSILKRHKGLLLNNISDYSNLLFLNTSSFSLYGFPKLNLESIFVTTLIYLLIYMNLIYVMAESDKYFYYLLNRLNSKKNIIKYYNSKAIVNSFKSCMNIFISFIVVMIIAIINKIALIDLHITFIINFFLFILKLFTFFYSLGLLSSYLHFSSIWEKSIAYIGLYMVFLIILPGLVPKLSLITYIDSISINIAGIFYHSLIILLINSLILKKIDCKDL